MSVIVLAFLPRGSVFTVVTPQMLPLFPSLRKLVPSGSLIRCEPAQVYHHHPRCRVTTLYGPPMRIGAWAISPSCGLRDRATLCGPRGSLRSWSVCRNEFSFGYWPASDVGRHYCGCRVDVPLNLPRDRLWIIPCPEGGGEVPQTAGRKALGVLFRTLGYPGSSP
jgi:hypothetical protein